MCFGGPPPAPPPPPPAPQLPPPPPPPPAPPAPPPSPVSAGEKVGTIKTAASMRSARQKSAGAKSFRAPTPTPSLGTISGQATGLNIPGS
jgi:hypothetical protein